MPLGAGDLGGGGDGGGRGATFKEKKTTQYVFAKPEDKETFVISRGCQNFHLCDDSFLRAKDHLMLSATDRKGILHCELLAITQVSDVTRSVYRTPLTLTIETFK